MSTSVALEGYDAARALRKPAWLAARPARSPRGVATGPAAPLPLAGEELRALVKRRQQLLEDADRCYIDSILEQASPQARSLS